MGVTVMRLMMYSVRVFMYITNPYVWHIGIFCWGTIETWDMLCLGVIKQGCNVEDHE